MPVWLCDLSNSEDINRSYRLASSLVLVGASLNTIGYVFVMEGPGEEYAAAKTYFWRTLVSWRSNVNPELATVTFYIATALLLILLIVACVRGFRLLSTSSLMASPRADGNGSATSAEAAMEEHVQA